MAIVNGTAGKDFIHRTGDGKSRPPGTTIHRRHDRR